MLVQRRGLDLTPASPSAAAGVRRDASLRKLGIYSRGASAAGDGQTRTKGHSLVLVAIVTISSSYPPSPASRRLSQKRQPVVQSGGFAGVQGCRDFPKPSDTRSLAPLTTAPAESDNVEERAGRRPFSAPAYLLSRGGGGGGGDWSLSQLTSTRQPAQERRGATGRTRSATCGSFRVSHSPLFHVFGAVGGASLID